MGRPKTRKVKAGEDMHLSVNLDGALVQALDKEADRLMVERPGLKFTRTDALRVVLHDWMSAQKKEI
jgi:hypothetical protein